MTEDVACFVQERARQQLATAQGVRQAARMQRNSDDMRAVADRIEALAEAQLSAVEALLFRGGPDSARLIRVLASLHNDHAEYRQEWRP